ncbi:MAG: hypothetical protein IKR27_08955 [Lachnospiraceae bacterium]|nr:hypothetical protein [Lachnospiraceae bacterium]
MKKTVSIILLLCLMLSMTACGSKAPELTKTNKIMPVYYTVKKGDISSVNVCTGSVMPELTEVYFGTDGNVDKINFRLGDKVKAGDEIYVMNSELAEENEKIEKNLQKYTEISEVYKNEHEDSIQKMKNRLSQMYGYEREMYETEISEVELNFMLEEQSREADAVKIRQELKEGRDKEEKSVIKAPCDGTIVYMAVQDESKISNNALAVVIADTSKKYFCYDYKKDNELRKIERTELIIGSEKIENPEILKYTDEELQDAKDLNKNLYTRYDLSGKDIELGTYGCVIEESNICKDVIYVPNECLYEDDDSDRLYVMKKDGEKDKAVTYVTIGNVCDNFTEITEGLSVGDSIFWCDDEHNSNYKYTQTTVKKDSFYLENVYTDIKKSFYENNKFAAGVPGRIDQIFLEKTTDIYVTADTKIMTVIPSVTENDYENSKIEYDSAKLEYEKALKDYNSQISEKEQKQAAATGNIEKQLIGIEIDELAEELTSYEESKGEELEELKQKMENYNIWKNGEPVTVTAGYEGVFNAINAMNVGASTQRADQIIAFISSPDKYYLSVPDSLSDASDNITFGSVITVNSVSNDVPVSFSARVYACSDITSSYKDYVIAIPDEDVEAEKINDSNTSAKYEYFKTDDVLCIDAQYVLADEKGNTYVLLKVDDNDSLVKRNVTVVKKNSEIAWIASGLNEGDVCFALDK